jgi:hypothetical protein
MFGNHSEIEQCQNRTPVELDCCCENKFMEESLVAAIPIGMITALVYSVGLIAIAEQGRINAGPKTICEKIKDVRFNYTWLYYCLMIICPKVIQKVAYMCIKDLDERLVGSSHILFAFVFTIMIALYIHPNKKGSEDKTLLYLCTLVCFGGCFAVLKHMPYEDAYDYNEFFDHIRQTNVIIYLAINGIVAGVFFGFNRILFFIISHTEETLSNVNRRLENKHTGEDMGNELQGQNRQNSFENSFMNQPLLNDDENIIHLEDQAIQTDAHPCIEVRWLKLQLFFYDKASSVFQVWYLMGANTLLGVGITSWIHMIDHWRSEKFEVPHFIILAVMFGVLLVLPLLFFGLRFLLHVKDPVFMAVMTCSCEVISRAAFVYFVYNQNFSCSMLEHFVYRTGFFLIGTGMIGFLFTFEQIASK